MPSLLSRCRIVSLVGLLLLSVTIAGCVASRPHSVTVPSPVRGKNPKDQIANRVEDWKSYAPVEDPAEKSLFPIGCGAYVDFMKEIRAGEIKKVVLYHSLLMPKHDLSLYVTPNYRRWTSEEFARVNACATDAGSIGALKVFPDHLLWGFPSCSTGGAPSPDERPAYEDFVGCVRVERELHTYLGYVN